MSDLLDVPVDVIAIQNDPGYNATHSSGSGPPRLSVAAQVRRHNLAVAWFLATVSGAWIIHAISGLTLARLLAPVIAMLAYVTYGLAQRQRNTAKLADSVYFMGFLWTLFALIDTLIRSQAIQLNAVFRVFGYALITTGCGMFIRLLLIQFTETVSDQLVDAREDVDDEVRAFMTQMRAGTGQMADFAQACDRATAKFTKDLELAGGQIGYLVGQIYADSMANLVKDVKGTVATLAHELGVLSDTVVTLKQEVSDTSKQITTGSRRVSATISKAADQLEQSGQRLEQTLDGLNGSLSDPKGAAAGVVQRMNDLVIHVSATAETIQRVATECAKGVKEGLEELQKTIADLPHDPELTRASGDLARSLTGTAQELTRVTDSAKALIETTGRASAVLEQAVGSMTVAVHQTNESATKTQKAVSEVVQFTRDRLAARP